MKLFVSCPMNGRTHEEIFREQVEALTFIRSMFPDDVVSLLDNLSNKAEKNDEIKRPRIDILGQSVRLMAQADLVVFSGEWWNAPGCCVEKKVASEYNLPTCLLSVEKPQVRMYGPEAQQKQNNKT